ncbi:MAG: hypothetical protein HYT79_05200 [Elusimicrobia bacterium]|nr:hypothetical protein [Elusimicrobiota bacterium]
MKQNNPIANIRAARKKAEESVSDMQDQKLKEKAFEVILGHLLSGGGSNVGFVANSTHKKQALAVPARTAKGSGKGGPTERVSDLAREGFFKNAKSIFDVREALRVAGHSYPITTLSPILVRQTRRRVLRRTQEVRKGKGKIFVYSNW